MNNPSYFSSKKSLRLFGLFDNFNFIKKLYIKNKLPKVLMLSGKKGSGKSTLLNHLLFFIFDNKNYSVKDNELKIQSTFYNQFIGNIFSNIIYLSGLDFKNTKVEDIRNLKKKIFQSSISNQPRFIIFDDVELFNINSLNALLKIIEEPTKNNYFVLINNKSKILIDTIKSRCLDIKIILNEEKRINIIESLIKKFDINLSIEPNNSKLTPGNFIKYNYIFNENHMQIENNFLKNLIILLNLYKKDKDIMFINMMTFLTDNYFNSHRKKNVYTSDKIIECKEFVLKNINKFYLYNLNQNALLNNINNKING